MHRARARGKNRIALREWKEVFFDGGLIRRPTPDLNRNLLVFARCSTIELLLVTPGRLRSAKLALPAHSEGRRNWDTMRVERSSFVQFLTLLPLPFGYSPIRWARQESNLHFACNFHSIAWCQNGRITRVERSDFSLVN